MRTAPKSPLLLQATTAHALQELLPGLEANLQRSGAWLNRSDGPFRGAANLHLELHRSAAHTLYAALIRCGLDLSRSAHVALASLCSRQQLRIGETIELKLELRSLPRTPHLNHAISA